MKFRPIYRTGEFGRIRFIDKNTLEIKYINKLTGKVHRADTYDQVPGLSIKSDKRRIIKRRGLAKKVWQAAPARMVTGGKLNGAGVSNIGRVVVRGSKTNPTLRIENNLRYAMDAFKTNGDRSVDSALRRASDKMMNRVADKVAKQLRAL